MEQLDLMDAMNAAVTRGAQEQEGVTLKGKYDFECYDKDGNLKWKDTIENVVCTVGKNTALDAFLAGSAYTVVGPFMGLISSVGYGAGPVVGDTMASHPGWTEAGGANAPTYTAPRKTAAWSAASAGSKALSAALVFSITATGQINGAFMVYGTGALSTIDNTAGVLLSAGAFAAFKSVSNGDTLNVSYSLGM
jgi:hypothetical protein